MKKLILYGEVGQDFTAKSVAKELTGDEDIEVHVNSVGGSVFDGLAIYNVLKKYSGAVTVYIDGVAASAASLIICAGDKVYMAENGLVMVHQATAGLAGFFGAEELDKVSSMLSAIRDSIVTTYETRTKQPRAKIEELVDAETWLDAAEAKALGFVDEITESVEAEYDAAAKVLFVNRVELDCRQLTQFEKIMAAVKPVAKEEKVVAEENQFNLEQIKLEAAAAERTRISSLLALKCDNSAVNAVVDLAIADGKELGEIQKYVDAVKNAAPKVQKVEVEAPKPSVENAALEKICAMIRDNMRSGAQEVEGSAPEPVASEAAKRESQAEMLAKYVNARLKGGAVK